MPANHVPMKLPPGMGDQLPVPTGGSVMSHNPQKNSFEEGSNSQNTAGIFARSSPRLARAARHAIQTFRRVLPVPCEVQEGHSTRADADTVLVKLHRKGSVPRFYDPAPGVPFARMRPDQKRIVLEQRINRASIRRAEAEKQAIHFKARVQRKDLAPMPLESEYRTEVVAQWSRARRVAKKFSQEEEAAKAMLGTLPDVPAPQKHPGTLTFLWGKVPTNPGMPRVDNTYKHGKNYSKVPRPISRPHCRKTTVLTVFTGLLLITMIMGQDITSWPFLNNFPAPAAGAPAGTTVGLQLNNAAIIADSDGVFTFWQTNLSYVSCIVENAPFVNFTIGDGIHAPKEYFASTGLNWWSLEFEPQDWGINNSEVTKAPWYNVTITRSMKQYVQSFSVEPMILGKGNCKVTDGGDPYTYAFNGSGYIGVVVWTAMDFGLLSVNIDSEYLKEPNDAWNVTAAEIAVYQGGTGVLLTTRIDPGRHVLSFNGNGSLNFTICHQYDADNDLLLDSAEIQHYYDKGTFPQIADVWGVHTSIIENTTEVIEYYNLTLKQGEELWQRAQLEVFVPAEYAGETMAFYVSAVQGEFTGFLLDGEECAISSDTHLRGFYSLSEETMTVVDEGGNSYSGPASDFYYCERESLGNLDEGWHTISYYAKFNPLSPAEINFDVNGKDIVIWEEEQENAPELDSDGDGIPSIADLSPEYYSVWEPGTIEQLVLPVSAARDKDYEVEIQVVKPPYDKSTSNLVEWHQGEKGSQQVGVTLAMRLFGLSNTSALDYWYNETTGEPFTQFWGEGGVAARVVTRNLVDVNSTGGRYNATGDLELLPKNVTAYDYWSLVYPSSATETYTFTLEFPRDHVNLEDGALSIFYAYCYVVSAINEKNGSSEILHVYDVPTNENLTQTGIQLRTYEDVNGIAASPTDYVSTQAIWARNQNPAMISNGEFESDVEVASAILTEFTGAHYQEAFFYDIDNPDTWSVAERLTRGSLTESVAQRQLMFNFNLEGDGQFPAHWGQQGSCQVTSHELVLSDSFSSSISSAWRSFNESISSGNLAWKFKASGTPFEMGLAEGGMPLAFITAKADGGASKLFYGTTELATIALNTWYTLAIDFSAGKQLANISISGTRILTNAAFLVPGIPDEFIAITGISEAGYSVYLDDVQLSWSEKEFTPKQGSGTYVQYITYTKTTMDVLFKLALGVKYDQSGQGAPEYVSYNATWDFYGKAPGTGAISCGWNEICGSQGSGTVQQSVLTHANPLKLVPAASDFSYGVFRDFDEPHVNGSADFWVLLDAFDSPLLNVTLNSTNHQAAIEIVFKNENIYYRNGTELVPLGPYWYGVWWHLNVEWDCKEALDSCDITISGPTYYASKNLTLACPADAIQDISFNTVGGIAYIDSIGFAWDDNFKGNDYGAELIKGSDTEERISFYNVADVYNGTHTSDSAELQGDTNTLYDIKWDDFVCEHEIMNVGSIPVTVDIVRAHESPEDGWITHDYLAIIYASGMCSPAQPPMSPAEACATIALTTLEVCETTHELNGELTSEFAPTVCYNSAQGDTSKDEPAENAENPPLTYEQTFFGTGLGLIYFGIDIWNLIRQSRRGFDFGFEPDLANVISPADFEQLMEYLNALKLLEQEVAAQLNFIERLRSFFLTFFASNDITSFWFLPIECEAVFKCNSAEWDPSKPANQQTNVHLIKVGTEIGKNNFAITPKRKVVWVPVSPAGFIELFDEAIEAQKNLLQPAVVNGQMKVYDWASLTDEALSNYVPNSPGGGLLGAEVLMKDSYYQKYSRRKALLTGSKDQIESVLCEAQDGEIFRLYAKCPGAFNLLPQNTYIRRLSIPHMVDATGERVAQSIRSHSKDARNWENSLAVRALNSKKDYVNDHYGGPRRGVTYTGTDPQTGAEIKYEVCAGPIGVSPDYHYPISSGIFGESIDFTRQYLCAMGESLHCQLGEADTAFENFDPVQKQRFRDLLTLLELPHMGRKFTVDELKQLQFGLPQDTRNVWEIIAPLLEEMYPEEESLAGVVETLGLGFNEIFGGIEGGQFVRDDTLGVPLNKLFKHNSVYRNIEAVWLKIHNLLNHLSGAKAIIPFRTGKVYLPYFVAGSLNKPLFSNDYFRAVENLYKRFGLRSSSYSPTEYNDLKLLASGSINRDAFNIRTQWLVICYQLIKGPNSEFVNAFATQWLRLALNLHSADTFVENIKNQGLMRFVDKHKDLKLLYENYPETVWFSYVLSTIRDTIDHPAGVPWLGWQKNRLEALIACALGTNTQDMLSALYPSIKNCNLEDVLAAIPVKTTNRRIMKVMFPFTEINYEEVPQWVRFFEDFIEYLNSLNVYSKSTKQNLNSLSQTKGVPPFLVPDYYISWAHWTDLINYIIPRFDKNILRDFNKRARYITSTNNLFSRQ